MSSHVCFIDIPQDGMHRLHPHDNRSCNRQNERDLSPMSLSSSSSSPRYEHNISFFQQLSRRFGFKSSDDLANTGTVSDDSYSTSPDSCSSTSGAVPNMKLSLSTSRTSSSSQTHLRAVKSGLQPHYKDSSSEQLSYASSDSSNSNIDINNELQFQLSTINATTVDNTGQRRLSRISRLHRRSTSSICKVFDVISKSSGRSLSCSGGEISHAKENGGSNGNSCSSSPPKSALKSRSTPSELRKQSISSATKSNAKSKSKEEQQPPQRILRQPVSYI